MFWRHTRAEPVTKALYCYVGILVVADERLYLTTQRIVSGSDINEIAIEIKKDNARDHSCALVAVEKSMRTCDGCNQDSRLRYQISLLVLCRCLRTYERPIECSAIPSAIP